MTDQTEDWYAMYFLDAPISDILAFHIKKYGTPPQILLVNSIKDVDVPEGMKVVEDTYVLPKHILIGL